MDKTTYLKNQQVQSFTNWLEYRMNQPNSFLHSYEMLKPKKAWECHSIYNAFEEYEWKFDSFEPQTGEKISGKTFVESSIFLEQLSNGLKESIDQRNEELCKTYCFAILKWGGVLNNNKDRIERISSEYGLLEYFTQIKEILKPTSFDSTKYKNVIKKVNLEDLYCMNAGFTKIYSLLLDDFIIYDGRVGASLGLFVRLYSEENGLNQIPEYLSFAYGDSRKTKFDTGQNRRDPSNHKYHFSKLSNDSKKHTENNIKANWLLKEIAENTKSNFAFVDEKIQLRALESALFMIGYDVKSYQSMC